MIGSHMMFKMAVINCKEVVVMLFTLVYISAHVQALSGRSFGIDFKNSTFVKDGKPFRYISGSIHYSRVPYQYWEDRLAKMYAAGLDAIQVYVTWNTHEPSPGVYDFSGQQDVVGFLRLAQKVGLLVILRPGPYICAEWEYGGLPAWLLRDDGDVKVRTMDPRYINAMDRWLNVFLPKMAPLLYVNGGPIIMVQVENEYGSYSACDRLYTRHLRNEFIKYLGKDALLFTTDGNGIGYLNCGTIDGVYSTVDFGPGGNVTAAFEPQKMWDTQGPLVNSEFYAGWLDLWGKPHSQTNTKTIVNALQQILDMGANVNFYMFEGGTNFGYMNGAEAGGDICITSYDYDAPLTEAGDITDKYLAIRDTISKYKRLPPGKIPPSTPKSAYGTVQMAFVKSVLDALPVIGPPQPIKSQYPLSMEQVGQNYGFILYRHTLKKTYPSEVLKADGIRDRGYVFVDGIFRGLLDRYGVTSFNLLVVESQTLSILVENQGRINFGSELFSNRKGLISNVTFGADILEDWEIYPLNFERLFKMPGIDEILWFQSGPTTPSLFSPSIYSGQFVVPDLPKDTYLNMQGWFKGQAFINGFNLGRYWPVRGPQVTMYVPKTVLKPAPAKNILMLVELDRAPCDYTNSEPCTVRFVDAPILNVTTHCSDTLWDKRELSMERSVDFEQSLL
ncbi:Beta-galactosidase [Lamellibrachia satsuma]|nr:Beta-galactosidase [Lamellibrachia satsuma]